MAISTELYTYQDMTEMTLDHFNLDYSGRDLRLARRAVLNAYRSLPSQHRWSYYVKSQQVRTEASQTDGTIAYDHTGGSYERMVTLSGATWPSTADFGLVAISDVPYRIESRESDTIITLTSDSNPGSDVAAGTSYTWYRAYYPLSVRFVRSGELSEVGSAYVLQYVTPEELLQFKVGNYLPSRPSFYTIRNAGEYYGSLSVEFQPPPSDARTYDFMAELRPRPLMTENYSDGTVTVSAGSTTVTGATTAFTSAHVGAIIRFSSSSTTAPTSQMGSIQPASTDGVMNPYVAQRVIASVESGTSLTIDATASTSALSAVKYVISDPIDVETGAMFTYFQRLVEYEMAILTREEKLNQRRQLVEISLRDAAGADSRNKDMGGAARQPWSRLGDLAIIDYSNPLS